jgi:uncharacterized protein (DUF302 family)
MKKKPFFLSLNALLLWVPAALALDYDYTVTTAKSVDFVVDSITVRAQADGFKVPGVHTLPSSDAFVLVELCDPMEAKKVMAVDMKLGLLLPCGKIGVWQDAKDGRKTKISMLLPSSMSRIHPAKEVAAMASALEPRLRKIVDAVK